MCSCCKIPVCSLLCQQKIHSEFISLYVDLPKERKIEYENLGKEMWMHGTRTTVFTYMNYMRKFNLQPGLYSSGVLYEHHIYPMTGALGGDLTSDRENVGKKVVSGMLNTNGESLNRNVYYTTYFEDPISTEQLSTNLNHYIDYIIKRKGSGLSFVEIFGLISRLRYWDNTYYIENFDVLVNKNVLPLIYNKLQMVVDTKRIKLIEDAINVVIKAKTPVIQFTNKDKKELSTTFPLVFLSEKMAKEAISADTMVEKGEMYINQLLMSDVDIIYTTSIGCEFVIQKMKEFGNNKVHVICEDSLFKDSDTLTGFPGQFQESKKERQRKQRVWKEWREALPFWTTYPDDLKLSKISDSMEVNDFKDSSKEELQEFFDETFGYKLSDEQVDIFYSYLHRE